MPSSLKEELARLVARYGAKAIEEELRDYGISHGRPTIDDDALHEAMAELLVSSKATSFGAAAEHVAGRATGASRTAILKRLVRKFEAYANNVEPRHWLTLYEAARWGIAKANWFEDLTTPPPQLVFGPNKPLELLLPADEPMLIIKRRGHKKKKS